MLYIKIMKGLMPSLIRLNNYQEEILCKCKSNNNLLFIFHKYCHLLRNIKIVIQIKVRLITYSNKKDKVINLCQQKQTSVLINIKPWINNYNNNSNNMLCNLYILIYNKLSHNNSYLLITIKSQITNLDLHKVTKTISLIDNFLTVIKKKIYLKIIIAIDKIV